MLKGRIREDGQAVVEVELACRDKSSHPVPGIIDTGFNGQASLSRQLVSQLDITQPIRGP